jgi:hypothetical protein
VRIGFPDRQRSSVVRRRGRILHIFTSAPLSTSHEKKPSKRTLLTAADVRLKIRSASVMPPFRRVAVPPPPPPPPPPAMPPPDPPAMPDPGAVPLR